MTNENKRIYFKRNLDHLIKKNNLTQAYLGAICNLSGVGIYYLRTGKTVPRFYTLIKLATFFRVDLDQMVYEKLY